MQKLRNWLLQEQRRIDTGFFIGTPARKIIPLYRMPIYIGRTSYCQVTSRKLPIKAHAKLDIYQTLLYLL